MAATRTYTNLKGKPFEEPPEGQWYNLATHRKVKIAPGPDYILVAKPRVTGTLEMIGQFMELQATGSTPSSASPKPKPSSSTPSSASPKPKPKPSPSTVDVVSKPKPKPPHKTYHLTSTDVETVPRDILGQLSEFTLTGLKTKAVVEYIVDGDTLDLVFIVPTMYLTSIRQEPLGRTKTTHDVCSALTFKSDRGMCIKMRTRIACVDAAEKDTTKGKVAKRLLQDKIGCLNFIVYIEVTGFEKFGRLLAHVYEDDRYTTNILTSLLDYSHPTLGCVFVSYNGGKKTPWPTTPPRFELDPEFC